MLLSRLAPNAASTRDKLQRLSADPIVSVRQAALEALLTTGGSRHWEVTRVPPVQFDRRARRRRRFLDHALASMPMLSASGARSTMSASTIGTTSQTIRKPTIPEEVLARRRLSLT